MEILLISLLFCASGCKPEPAGIGLDELQDMETYSSGMLVDASYYRGKRTEVILVNRTTYQDPGTLDLTRPGYYRIEVNTDGSSGLPEAVIRLVVLDAERGESEWGLAPWTPRGSGVGTLEMQEVLTLYPPQVPPGKPYPLVVLVGGQVCADTGNLSAMLGSASFRIKRGAGSAWVPAEEDASALLKIDQHSFALEPGFFPGSPLLLNGLMEEDMHIPAGSYVRIDEDLTIPHGLNLFLEAGVYVEVDPGVNIYYEGRLVLNGTPDEPVTITCTAKDSFWGGMVGSGSGNSLEASHAILCRSGYHSEGIYDYGHAHRQALCYCESGSIELDHCYLMDHAGQVFFPVSATVNLEYSLVQRAKTGGQVNSSWIGIDHCIFTDFPDDQPVFGDEDNDGLYLMGSDASISNSVFMYARDDGLDSGGSGGGEVTVSHTRFESVFHEGAALSSGEEVFKTHHFSHCRFVDCGQGLELGYSSPKHTVLVDSCTFLHNGIGIRYGDNYESLHRGLLRVSNSRSVENEYYDVWNMLRENWEADTFRMEFENVTVSIPDPMYPQLKTDE